MCHYRKKKQNITDAMILVKVAKRRLQALRDNEWDPILKKEYWMGFAQRKGRCILYQA